jgi:hypothetical protein
VRCHLEIDPVPSSRRRCERSYAWYHSGDEHNKKQRTHPHDARHHLTGSQGDRTAQRVCATPEGVPGVERKQPERDGTRSKCPSDAKKKKKSKEPRQSEAFPTFRASSTMTVVDRHQS